MKKLLALLLAAMMVLTMTAAVAEGTGAASEKGTIVYGSVTEIGGDFAPDAWWTNNASDKMLRELSNDFGTVQTDRGGALVQNPSAVESIEGVLNKDGTKTYTVKVKKGLVYNNGEAITAKDFIVHDLYAASPLGAAAGVKDTLYLTLVGGKEYHDGTVDHLPGLRLLDDYTLQKTVVKEKVPYFYELAYVAQNPMNIRYWLGENIEVKDDGEGAYFAGTYTPESVAKQMEFARFHAGEDRVTAGPYNLVAFDQSSRQATLTINPNFAGNFEGQKPSIKKLVIVKAEDATWADAMKTGTFNFYDTIADGKSINTAMDMIEAGAPFQTVQFYRAGYGQISFQCDFGPTQFKAVRHAIAKLFDRTEFANPFCQGWGGLVYGPYSSGLWQYQEAEEWLNEKLNTYTYDPDAAVQLLVDDGWVLNEKGEPWTEGIRYKKVTAEEAGSYQHNVKLADGTILMGLIIDWSSSEGNPVSELLNVMLAKGEQTKAAGMQINLVAMTFDELLNYYYRDATQGEKYGVPTYCMYNLGTGFDPRYDYSYNFTSDPQMVKDGYNITRLFDNELDKLSMDMVFGVASDDTEKYMELWKQFVLRWNDQLPEVPLYSNIYVTMYPSWLENYEQDSFWNFQSAILYATVAE